MIWIYPPTKNAMVTTSIIPFLVGNPAYKSLLATGSLGWGGVVLIYPIFNLASLDLGWSFAQTLFILELGFCYLWSDTFCKKKSPHQVFRPTKPLDKKNMTILSKLEKVFHLQTPISNLPTFEWPSFLMEGMVILRAHRCLWIQVFWKLFCSQTHHPTENWLGHLEGFQIGENGTQLFFVYTLENLHGTPTWRSGRWFSFSSGWLLGSTLIFRGVLFGTENALEKDGTFLVIL